ncbi:hypothetical protein F2Q70_00008554 [Brassica cretica]|uniref:Uncharacterized protein n=1 Tax=Brassica cretica TaxID=69181 RepID=A0A8S9LPD7_BRACR|nr:hypothetical protein F2Q68_00001603 [Brassica cretica]KAF2609850.1 hypothetical protein F2Q70_00008554 [Brassica cretica]
MISGRRETTRREPPSTHERSAVTEAQTLQSPNPSSVPPPRQSRVAKAKETETERRETGGERNNHRPPRVFKSRVSARKEREKREAIIFTRALLVDWIKGKILIVSNGAPSVAELKGPPSVAELKGPNDVTNLM